MAIEIIWIHEDDLPEDMDGMVYDYLWSFSRIVDGVRMFPMFQSVGEP